MFVDAMFVVVMFVVPSGPLSARTGESVKLPVRARLCSFRSL